MPLTPEQKAAGRAFRSARQAWLASLDPAGARCSPHGPPWYRHECPKARAGTVALSLKTRSVPSPDFDGVPAGFFRFCWLEGTCRACGFTVRSGTGFIALAQEETVAG